MFTVLDALTGLNQDNASLDTEEDDLTLYRMITLIWFPIQFLLLCLMLWYVPQAGHLNLAEKLGICFGMGVATGTIGINYSHELMHQKSRLERWLADLLLATVLYSHFRSEHLRVHHLYVGTPAMPSLPATTRISTASCPAWCWKAGPRPSGRNGRCWRARGDRGSTRRTRSGATGRCRRGWWPLR